jgi:hypothetical protein
MPGMIAAPAACPLLIGKIDRPMRSAHARRGQSIRVCRVRNRREVQFACEDGPGKPSLKRCQIEHG